MLGILVGKRVLMKGTQVVPLPCKSHFTPWTEPFEVDTRIHLGALHLGAKLRRGWSTATGHAVRRGVCVRGGGRGGEEHARALGAQPDLLVCPPAHERLEAFLRRQCAKTKAGEP